jgi:hypothetical protein
MVQMVVAADGISTLYQVPLAHTLVAQALLLAV